MRFAAFLEGREPSEQLVREYLMTRGEWIGREFKAAAQPAIFGLRVAVAAFANTEGGDLFLGVSNSGGLEGTSIDPVEISAPLRQEGAPERVGCITNLLQVVHDPRRILLGNGRAVFWIDVAPQGQLVAVLRSDGALGLYDRPGAESEEVRGFDAIDLFTSRTRARLLVRLYAETKQAVNSIPQYYTVPGAVTEDVLTPIRFLLESQEWQVAASSADRGLVTSRAYLGSLLAFPADARAWEALPHAKKGENWRMRVLGEIGPAVANLRAYLLSQRIVPPD